MERWKSFLALAVAGALITGPAWAQQTTKPGDAQAPAKPAEKSGDTAADPKASDQSPSKSQAGSPAGAPSTGTDTSGSAAPGSATGDTTKSDTMKSDTMKSGRGAGKSAGGGNRDQVKVIQQALKDKGHDPGDIDGVMGPKTKAALKDFQKAEGLKDTGMPDSETLAKLGVEAKSSATGSSGSSPSASPSTSGSAGAGTSGSAPAGEKKTK